MSTSDEAATDLGRTTPKAEEDPAEHLESRLHHFTSSRTSHPARLYRVRMLRHLVKYHVESFLQQEAGRW